MSPRSSNPRIALLLEDGIALSPLPPQAMNPQPSVIAINAATGNARTERIAAAYQ